MIDYKSRACETIKDTIDIIIENCPPEGIIVESGTYIGITTAFIVDKFLLSGKSFKLFTIDNFNFGNVPEHIRKEDGAAGYESYLKNITDWAVKPYITTIKSDVFEAIELFKNNSVYCLFLDDFHEYNHVKKQLQLWLPKMLSKGAMIIGDDYYLSDIQGAFHEIWGNKVKSTSKNNNGCIVYL